MASLCCVTMVYNEAILLPVWMAYYANIVGEDHCYIIDHGSTDGSASAYSRANRIAIPRSAHDDHTRALFVEDFCSALLKYYDFVLFTDVDEIVVADPDYNDGLISYLDNAPDVTTCIGFELRHTIGEEPDLDTTQPILSQRRYASPTRTMCKPSLIGRRVSWTPGFHSYDGPLQFGGLFLFHLAYVDLRMATARQRKRQTHFYAREDRAAPHHQVDAEKVQSWMEAWARLPAIDSTTFRVDCPHLLQFIADMIASNDRRDGGVYGFDMMTNPREKWRVPERFLSLF